MGLWKLGTSNALNTTLNGNVATGDTSITLTSASGLQAPGVLVIDRQDINGKDTPALREYVSYTGISTNTITGVTRGLGGSIANAHASSAKVEEVFTITHWNDLIAALLNVFTITGAIDTAKVVDLTTAQALSNKTITSPILTGTVTGGVTVSGTNTFTGTNTFKATVPTIVTDTDGSTVTFDLSAGNIHQVTLGGNRALALSNVTTGQAFMIRLIQDGSGSRTVTWFGTIKWPSNVTPALTATANKTDVFGFVCTSSGNYDGYIVGQNL